MKILLLEDDKALSFSIKELLELHNYSVDTAYSANEAYDLIYNNSYDLFLFDVKLPDEDGLEVFKNIKNLTSTPTIYISANFDIYTIAEAFKLGAEDYLKKPFSVEELLIRIESKYNTKIKIGDFLYDMKEKSLYKNNEIIKLGKILKEILYTLVSNKNKITNKNILLDIVNFNEASLRVHINKLKKLGFDINNLRGEGYILKV